MDSSQRFFDLWEWCGGQNGAAGQVLLDKAYGDPARSYHNWAHIDAMLDDLDGVRRGGEFADVAFPEVELAIYFHDVVYDAQASDNEAKSAAIFRKFSVGIDVVSVSHIAALILATAKHEPSEDASARLLLDLDLAVLGVPARKYDAYAAAVRKEYAHVPEDKWRKGRAQVLERFQQRPAIYQTRHFSQRLEQQARQNIKRELASLS